MKRFSLVLCCGLVCAAGLNQETEEKLWRYRNLGKAFYENPTTQIQAIDVFKEALDLDPGSVREQVNYALALMRGGKTEAGVAELQKVQKEDPKLPHTWFNLGIYYRKNGDFEKATQQFEEMTRLVPGEPKSHYNLGVLYKQAGRMKDAEEQFRTAVRLDPNLAAPHFQLYNVYRQAGERDKAMAELQIFQKLKKSQEGAAIPEDMEWCDYAEIWDPIDMKPERVPAPRYETRTLAEGLDPKTSGVLLLDLDGTGKSDLLAWSGKGISIYRRGTELINGEKTGLAGLTGVVSVASGDFDNDGLPDLCVLTDKAPLLYRNVKGRFEPFKADLPGGRFAKALWVDYDHDYDLDLFLFGDNPHLLRNQGESGFVDRTADYPFVKGQPIDAVLTRVMADSKAFDIVAGYADQHGVAYLDKLGEHFETKPVEALPAGAGSLKAQDVNHDSWLDLVYGGGVLMNEHGEFTSGAGNGAGASVDADFDGDGRIDEARVASDGKLEVAMNRTPGPNNWITVQLVGIKNTKLAYAAEVEVKAGELYDKKIYDGVPLTFNLLDHDKADTVRITWANGLIQNETDQGSGKAYVYREEQRLSGSCPMIWSWDGEKFRFISDVLGTAPLGASSGDGSYFPVDHDEFIQIPGEALKSENGEYRVRVSEELSEVAYLDQVRLIALDHPASIDIFTNDKWKSPPFPDFRLFGASRRVYPVSAVDDAGHDLRDALLRRDGKFAGGFKRTRTAMAEPHALTLDFGAAAPQNHAVLVMHGWTDWADGSTFFAASQENRGSLVTPKLQVRDAQGNWKTVIEDMGMPSGSPKTIAVDLTGKFRSRSREVRILTSICIYWDEAFLIEDSAPPPAVLTGVPAIEADLHYRGFSKQISSGGSDPGVYFYDVLRTTPSWNPTPGMYTRYGDVRELLTRVDDKYVIMGSGDEIGLRFNAASLPPLKPGWKRDFLLKVDGWAKDRDANTAFSDSVEPLPFHGMTTYPYPAGQHYPTDADHEAYRRKYNTRPALRLIRALKQS
ncbi:MAG TPA: tetratricopeptide repeat protein [Bryobacteraceae bacterium]|nr:tetratricopeptide repeat protein [Bryobacteraceae bacterium]